MKRKFHNKTAIITGASRGIGRAIALAMAKEGANIAFNYVSADETAKQTLREIEETGVKAIALKCDVSDLSQVKNFVSETLRHFQKIDILINNAGIIQDNLLMFMKEDEWNHVIDVNLKGTFFCLKCTAKEMAKQKYGRIINISSDAGLMGDFMRANYSASKAGIIGLTKTAARELANMGITVNAVAPGLVETDMTRNMEETRKNKLIQSIPMQRFGKTEEIAEAVLFLASDDASYITGEVLIVDGGLYTK